MRIITIGLLPALLASLLLPTRAARAERVKDIVTIKGERGNPLWGYGLVIGLNGTGDDSEVSKRALVSVLRKNNMAFDAGDIDAKNIASVIVTGELGPFDRAGSKIDVTVACIGDASSLQGGKLLMTPLVGADGNTYAIAQGSVVLGGFGASGQNASVSKGHLTAGQVPNGATVEREETAQIIENGEITLLLKNPDHTTAEHVAEAVNTIQEGLAHAADAGTVRIIVPKNVDRTKVNAFVDRIGKLVVETDQPGVVVINERTGTVIVGQNVTISTVAIAHGNLTITTEEKDYASQPPPLSGAGATTVELERSSVKAAEKRAALHVLAKPEKLTVSDLARALNAMGLTPRDLIAIFQALKQAGALQAELKVM